MNLDKFGINIIIPKIINTIISTMPNLLCLLLNKDLKSLNKENKIIPKTIIPNIIFKVVIFLKFYHIHHK
jgi:hypothetical protein